MAVSHNYSAAFVAFMSGASLEDIAQSMSIPLPGLQNKARADGWKRLAAERAPKAVATVATRADVAERDLAKMEANRNKMLALAEELQADALEMVQKLRAGKLKIKRMTSTGVLAEFDPTIRDRVDLASYVQKVGEVAYRALGDREAGAHEGGQGSVAAVVNIVLPAQVASPRAQRLATAEVVTIEPGRPLSLPVPAVEAEVITSS